MGVGAVFVGLAALQVITGSLNSIFAKLADLEVSKNSVGVVAWFDHPFLQV